MLRPLFKNVLIKPDPEEEVSAGGIILPTDAQEKPYYGEVIAIGDEVSVVRPGDRVQYKRWGGNEFEIDKVPHVMIEEIDLLAII